MVVCNGSSTRSLLSVFSVVSLGFTSRKNLLPAKDELAEPSFDQEGKRDLCGAEVWRHLWCNWGDAGSSRQVPASPGPALEVVPILLKDIPHSTILPLCIHIRKFYFEEASNRISGWVKSL